MGFKNLGLTQWPTWLRKLNLTGELFPHTGSSYQHLVCSMFKNNCVAFWAINYFPPWKILSQRQNVAYPSLTLRFFYWIIFTANIYHTMYTNSNHSHSLRHSLVRRQLHSDNIIPRTVALWKRLWRRFFSDPCHLNSFKSWVNRSFMSS